MYSSSFLFLSLAVFMVSAAPCGTNIGCRNVGVYGPTVSETVVTPFHRTDAVTSPCGQSFVRTVAPFGIATGGSFLGTGAGAYPAALGSGVVGNAVGVYPAAVGGGFVGSAAGVYPGVVGNGLIGNGDYGYQGFGALAGAGVLGAGVVGGTGTGTGLVV